MPSNMVAKEVGGEKTFQVTLPGPNLKKSIFALNVVAIVNECDEVTHV